MDASQAARRESFDRDRYGANNRRTAADGISLILFATHDDAALKAALADAQAALSAVSNRYEILVVSSAQTPQGGRDSHVRYLEAPQGDTTDWQTALEHAAQPWVVLAPADGRHNLRELERLLSFTADFDVVCGYRIGPERPWLRVAFDRCGALLAGMLLRTGVRDPGCGLKIYRRELLTAGPQFAHDDFSRVELLARLRLAEAKIVEVPITYRAPAAVPRTQAAPIDKFSPRQWVESVAGRPARWLGRLVACWWSQILFAQRRSPGVEDRNDFPWQGRQAVAAWCVLAAAAVIFFFSHLSFPLLEPDESRYARIAEQMVRTGDYLVPYRFGEPYLDKPPMLYWLTAASYRVFGISDGAARVVCAFAGLIAVLATYGLGRRLVGQRAAWIGAFSLMLCTGFALGGKFLLMDGLLTCFVTLAMLSGYLAIHGPRVRPGWCVAASVFCGLGVLTKGPLAIVLFLPPLLVSRWLTSDGPKLTWKHWAMCLAPGALLALPWFVAVTLREPQFLEYFFWRHHVARFTTDFSHDQPWWYYIPVLLLGMFPASLLLGPLSVYLFGNDAELRQQRSREMGYLLLVAGWILFFFTMSRGKLPPYIIPLLPPMCLLCGKLLDLLMTREASSSLFRRTREHFPVFVCQVALAGLVVVGVIDLILGGGRNYGFLIDCTMMIAGGSLFFYLPRSPYKHHLQQWTTAGGLAWIAMAYAFLNFYPDIAHSRSIAMQADEICEEYGDPHMPIVFFGRREESVLFYLSASRVREFPGKHPERLVDYLRRHPQTLLVSDRSDIVELRPHIPTDVTIDEVGGRGHLFLAKAKTANVAQGGKKPAR